VRALNAQRPPARRLRVLLGDPPTTWNWSPGNNDFFGKDVPGVFAGRFEMVVVLRVSRDGNSYTGNFVARNFDTHDVPIPSLDAHGTVRGTRITVD
jgi:hypothetical protein